MNEDRHALVASQWIVFLCLYLHGKHLAVLKENSTLKCSHNNHQPKMLSTFCDQVLQITLFGVLLNQSYLFLLNLFFISHKDPSKFFFSIKGGCINTVSLASHTAFENWDMSIITAVLTPQTATWILAAFHIGIMRLLLVETLVSLPLDLSYNTYIY